VSRGPRNRPPLSPREAWISDGRQVLHFRPTLWDRWSQRLEITSVKLLGYQPVPLLKRRLQKPGAGVELVARGDGGGCLLVQQGHDLVHQGQLLLLPLRLGQGRQGDLAELA
jgi:hypothetical protein